MIAQHNATTYLLSWLVEFEAEYSWDIALTWFLWLEVSISHQKEVRKCGPKISSVNILASEGNQIQGINKLTMERSTVA